MTSHSGEHVSARPLNINNMLECYDISPEHGFALSTPSITTFIDPQFQPWIDAARSLPMLISTHLLRSTIDGWPVLSPQSLVSLEEYRLAYVLLGHLVHAYIWGSHEEEDPLLSISASLSIPFLEIVQELEVPVGICFASTALWNYTILPDGKEGCLCSFTGTEDETHFNLTSYRVETAGAAALTSALLASRLSTAGPAAIEQVTGHLQEVAQSLTRCKEGLTKMKNGLSPDTFYFNIRPYLVSSLALPGGVFFQTDTKDPTQGVCHHLSGSTAGQSSLFQSFDIILGVEHSTDREHFVDKMRKGMPSNHSRFLRDLVALPHLRTFVCKYSASPQLVNAYHASLGALEEYRDEHIKIVTLFVLGPSKRAGERQQSKPQPVEKADQAEVGLKGTGGSELFSLLKDMRADMDGAQIR